MGRAARRVSDPRPFRHSAIELSFLYPAMSCDNFLEQCLFASSGLECLSHLDKAEFWQCLPGGAEAGSVSGRSVVFVQQSARIRGNRGACQIDARRLEDYAKIDAGLIRGKHASRVENEERALIEILIRLDDSQRGIDAIASEFVLRLLETGNAATAVFEQPFFVRFAFRIDGLNEPQH